MFQTKRFSLLFIFLLSLSFALAVPAKRSPITVLQPDGSEIEIQRHGDEHFKYTTTPDGYLIAKDTLGFYTYALLAHRTLIPSLTKVSPDIAVPSYAVKLSAVSSELAQMHNSAVANRMPARTKSRLVENNQAKKGLVLLVNFSDVKFVIPEPQKAFGDMLNRTGYSSNGATGSAVDYFHASSTGLYSPHFDVYGPYTLNRPMAYYGANSRSGGDMHPDQMVVDALSMLMADKTVNVNMSDYDSDNDGKIDFVFIYYAGHNEAEGAAENTIWPHSWVVYPYNIEGSVLFGGKTVEKYACTSELKDKSGRNMCGIGTFCHEFSHVLGLPDLYTTNAADHRTLDSWDVMDYGPYNNDGRTPPVFSAYERFFMDWLTPEILNADGDCSLGELKASNHAYLISGDGTHNLDGTSPYPETFYMLEYRTLEGWDEYLSGEGMMLTKIQFDENTWFSNAVNNNPDKMGVDLIEADGRDWGRAKPGDLFPGSESVTSFTLFDSCMVNDIKIFPDNVTFHFSFTEYIEDNTPAPKPYLSGNTVYNLMPGATLSCYTVGGLLLSAAVAETDSYTLDTPHGVCCIVVRQDGKKFTLKGIDPH